MPRLPQKRINLAAAIAEVKDQPAVNLTLRELVTARAVACLDDLDVRLRKWVDAFGDTSAWDMPAERLQAAAEAMIARGYKPSTVNRDVGALGQVYKWARDKRLTPRGFKSPTRDVPRFRDEPRVVHMPPEKIEALRLRSLAYPNRRFGVYVALLIDTGARKSELLNRRWLDVDLEKCEIYARTTKNKRPRVLFFRPETAALIRRVYPHRPDCDLVFEGRRSGGERQYDKPISFRAAWASLLREVGLEDFRQHDVRHVAAANLLKAGTSLPVAAQVLGHDPVILARRYGHLDTGHLRTAQQQAWALDQ